MDSLKRQRAVVKGSMTKLLTYVKGNIENASMDEVCVKQDRAQKLLGEFQAIEREMFDLDSNAESDLSEFEDNYYLVLAGLNAAIRKRSISVTKAQLLDNTMNASCQHTAEVRLPKINIPMFEGDYMEWQSFFDIYSSTIHERENLTAAQKFQYLRGLLKGEAASLIRHLPITDANYNEAFQKLIQRYDRKRHSVNAFIKTYMDQPTILQPTAANVRKLRDSLDESIRGLKALGSRAEKRDPWLIYIALNKLDNDTISLWTQETAETDFSTIEELLTFLGKRIDMLEALKGHLKKPVPSRMPLTKAYTVATTALTSADIPIKCPICRADGHRIYECVSYNDMSSEQKSEAVRSSNRCFNCLNGGHRVQECRSRARCQHCQRKHHTSLHGSSDESKVGNFNHASTPLNAQTLKIELSNDEDENKSNETVETKTYLTAPAATYAILPTAIVKIRDSTGKFQSCRALLDSASQASFISEACVNALNLKRENARILVKGLGESGMGTTKGITELMITSMDDTTKLTIQAFIIPKVSMAANQYSLCKRDIQMLNELPLADPKFYKRGSIDLLLGVDVFFKALESKKMVLESGLTAVCTSFGWIVAGTNSENKVPPHDVGNFNILLDIDNSLRKFWEIEETPKITRRTPDEQRCEELFQTTTKKAEDNKFIVKLPFKQPVNMLGTSYNAALNRLKAMERKFERDEEFAKMYKEFMAEYEKLGHMERVNPNNNQTKYYIPHHGVLKENSTTTKLRVVFDASVKSSTGISLNDILMVGPTVQPPLFNILLKFRQHRIVLCGDIEKMYRQVWVQQDDQRHQNILWRNCTDQQPGTYQLKTLTYGTASAAYLATRSLKEIGNQMLLGQPEAAQVILHDMYVDDMMTGGNSTALVQKLLTQVRSELGRHGFRMRKFLTNDEQLRSFIRYQTSDDATKEIGEHLDTPRVLGLQWDPYEDAFNFKVNLPERNVHTKRTLLSDASRTFDPLGWLSPIIIRVKILFQSLWMENLGWDDELSQSILKTWLDIRSDLGESCNVQITRWLLSTNQVTLIGFSDASEHAYAAAIYALVETSDGMRANLITAKSRVAPVNQISIPRLELMGALLLANLIKTVEESLTIKVINTWLFTDSKIVLDWLSTHPRRWTTFVANRVSEIIKLYKRQNWFHVSSKDNPADIASRGILACQLVGNKLWWHGPDWLVDGTYTSIIKSNDDQTRKMTTEELRPLTVDTFVSITNDFIENLINRYSSFIKMSKILAIIRRYINNLKHKKRERDITRNDIETAELILIRHIQYTEFPIEVEDLKSDKGKLTRSSKLVALNPFIDDRGIIRVGGRIQNSTATFDVKHPIILTAKHHAVKCIVRDAHITHNHSGISLLTSIIRRKYWIIQAKLLSKAVVRSCIKCIKQNPTTENQIMGNLPSARVQYVHPFHKVGVDYCGPFKVTPVRKRGQLSMKVYVCIFVCLSTKAVHIEAVYNLTTESFLAALSRFISRRGSCHTICSDNGTNFVGANNYLGDLFQFLEANASHIASALLKYKIEWKFIPPGTPHMGGIWEAAVKQAKIQLRRVVGETILTIEEFITLLTKIEAILNSRPIAVTQAEDIDCLTPAHFLIGRTFTDTADETIGERIISPMARWRLVKQMQQHFWNRWHREYLTSLQKRSKWTTESKNLAVDDIVLIPETGIPSTCWALGRVIKVHSGNDGNIRVVDIRLANNKKVITRSIHKLCKLPIQSYESTDSWPAEC